jgi:hypothetical protein
VQPAEQVDAGFALVGPGAAALASLPFARGVEGLGQHVVRRAADGAHALDHACPAERNAILQRVQRNDFNGEWNYTIAPYDPQQAPPAEPDQAKAPPIPAEATYLLTHPVLTGMSREQFDRLVEELEPCRRILAEAEREKRKGINRRGYNPGFGFLDHRHRVLAAVLNRRNTITLTPTARLLGRDRNTLSYHAHRTMPLPAFAAAPDITAAFTQPRRTHPPRTIDALQDAIADSENNIKSGSS